MKGVAHVRLTNGRVCLAELHWYEAHGTGKKEIKRNIDAVINSIPQFAVMNTDRNLRHLGTKLNRYLTGYRTITSSKSLTDLLLQCLEACQILFVSLMDLAGSVVRCGGFCAD